MLILIKQTEEKGLVSSFWIAEDKESLIAKLDESYPDPALKAALEVGHKFQQALNPFEVADARFTLMVEL